MRYFIKTFGCQANKSDSERIAAIYQKRGFQPAKTWRQANEIIINTCAVRQSAEDRVKGFLLNLTKHFPANKPKIVLAGCMTHYGQKKLRLLLPQVDQILSSDKINFKKKTLRQDKIHAWVPISTGCNSFCSYCIVPFARGREKSRPSQEILCEINLLAQQGYQEITLLGQNVNSYGLEKDNPSKNKLNQPSGPPPFVKLLRQIKSLKPIKKINFLTSNPWNFWDSLIDEVAQNKKINRYLHLPFQSGSDRILKLMNRKYTQTDYLNLINKIKIKIPDIVFGTDIIVGFPTETETDFQQTVALVKKVDFHLAFISRYSPRPGTKAFKNYPDNVPVQVKKQRFQILDTLINKKHFDHRPVIR